MKIIVYAISKNEEKFVDRWYESIKDADEIYVLDTGSTDKTVELLSKHKKIKCKQQIIEPWRFDKARNISLEMVPSDADICICLDLDEVLIGNWREIIEKNYDPKISRYRYTYNWSLDDNNKPIISYYGDKIHKRKGCIWVNPVHEILKYDKEEKQKYIDDLIINHYPDSTKSRSSYLPLLELSVKENPNNDRNMHYLGREYMFYGKYNEAIDTLIKHLKLPNATWKDERCASMRFIARCYKYLHRYNEAILWSDLAIKEAPYLKDAYMEKALIMFEIGNYKELEKLVRKALKININQKTYINESFTSDFSMYDYLSISCFYNGKYHAALKYVEKALKILQDERVLNNKEIILNKIKVKH